MNELLELGLPVAQLLHEAGVNLTHNVLYFLVGHNDAAAQLCQLRARDFIVGAGGRGIRERQQREPTVANAHLVQFLLLDLIGQQFRAALGGLQRNAALFGFVDLHDVGCSGSALLSAQNERIQMSS